MICGTKLVSIIGDMVLWYIWYVDSGLNSCNWQWNCYKAYRKHVEYWGLVDWRTGFHGITEGVVYDYWFWRDSSSSLYQLLFFTLRQQLVKSLTSYVDRRCLWLQSYQQLIRAATRRNACLQIHNTFTVTQQTQVRGGERRHGVGWGICTAHPRREWRLGVAWFLTRDKTSSREATSCYGGGRK